jgi:hypothetical protein
MHAAKIKIISLILTSTQNPIPSLHEASGRPEPATKAFHEAESEGG